MQGWDKPSEGQSPPLASREMGAAAWGVPHCNSTAFLSIAFQAFSAFYYNFKFLNLTEGQSLATVRENIKDFCTRSWEDVCSP